MEIFESVVAVFNFIFSVLETIVNGISGITSILVNVISLLLSITKILPTSLYVITYSFISVFSIVFLFKLIRKGWCFMLLNLVETILGELPSDLRFLYAFGCIFVLYILVKMFAIFIEIIRDLIGGL